MHKTKGDRAETSEQDRLELQEQGKTVSNHRMWEELQNLRLEVQGKGDAANRKKITKLVTEYNTYKRNKLRNFRFNPAKTATKFGKFHQDFSLQFLFLPQGEEQPPSTLKLIQIYFDTATFDESERDEKVKFTAALSLIGGTMGLLTGFSIISGIEIVFYLFKLVTPFVMNYLKHVIRNKKDSLHDP